MKRCYDINTLQYDPDLCTGCGMCVTVCPHGVFTLNSRLARLENPLKCMECGACALNCPPQAITVESGVGCASAMIISAITGKKEGTCGGGSKTPCCETESSFRK